VRAKSPPLMAASTSRSLCWAGAKAGRASRWGSATRPRMGARWSSRKRRRKAGEDGRGHRAAPRAAGEGGRWRKISSRRVKCSGGPGTWQRVSFTSPNSENAHLGTTCRILACPTSKQAEPRPACRRGCPRWPRAGPGGLKNMHFYVLLCMGIM
jgi:hypothetical protein